MLDVIIVLLLVIITVLSGVTVANRLITLISRVERCTNCEVAYSLKQQPLHCASCDDVFCRECLLYSVKGQKFGLFASEVRSGGGTADAKKDKLVRACDDHGPRHIASAPDTCTVLSNESGGPLLIHSAAVSQCRCAWTASVSRLTNPSRCCSATRLDKTIWFDLDCDGPLRQIVLPARGANSVFVLLDRCTLSPQATGFMNFLLSTFVLELEERGFDDAAGAPRNTPKDMRIHDALHMMHSELPTDISTGGGRVKVILPDKALIVRVRRALAHSNTNMTKNACCEPAHVFKSFV